MNCLVPRGGSSESLCESDSVYGSTESVSGKFLRPSDTAPRFFGRAVVLLSSEEMDENKKRRKKESKVEKKRVERGKRVR